MKKVLHSIVAALSVLSTTVWADEIQRFSSPFRDIDAEEISEVVLRTRSDAPLIRVADHDWTKELLATITEKDFPLQRGPMSFSLPGQFCTIALKDKSGKSLRVITVYSAWNLLMVTDNGRAVLGSNRRFAKVVIQKIEASEQDYTRKQREIYGDQFSGEFEKEYWDILKGEAGAGQSATRPESKSEGGDKPLPEAEGRSR